MAVRPQNVLVLTTQRTGSTWLSDMLYRHKQIRMYGEIFLDRPVKPNPLNTKLLPPLRFFEYSQSIRLPTPLKLGIYFSKINQWHEERQAIGFKLMYNHLKSNRRTFLALMKLHNYKVIHLVRVNHLETAVSECFHRASGVSHVIKGKNEGMELRSMHIDPQGLLKRIDRQAERVSRYTRCLTNWRLPHVVVSYEDLTSQLESTMGGLFDFLGIDGSSSELGSDYVKISKNRYSEKIVNLEELRSVLSASQYGRFLSSLS